MLFSPPGELPTATVRQADRSMIATGAAGVARWVAARWRWLRPRGIPVVVALASMLAMVRAVDYLTHPPEDSSLVGKAYTDSVRVVIHAR